MADQDVVNVPLHVPDNPPQFFINLFFRQFKRCVEGGLVRTPQAGECYLPNGDPGVMQADRIRTLEHLDDLAGIAVAWYCKTWHLEGGD